MPNRLGQLASKTVAACIAVVLVAGLAQATVPDSSGMIHGCYANKGGALRVIDSPSKSCKATEHPQRCLTP